jgi:hypothetical protein
MHPNRIKRFTVGVARPNDKRTVDHIVGWVQPTGSKWFTVGFTHPADDS